MGVYYRCNGCGKTLHLLPQSKGFGQMTIECFLCSKEAKYLPTGPGQDDDVVNAPVAEVSSIPKGAVPAIGGTGEYQPTVPLQAPEQLLALDAQETAPTLPVEGLSDEQIAQFMRGSAPEPSESGEYQPTVPVESPFAPPDDEDDKPTSNIQGLNLPSAKSAELAQPPGVHDGGASSPAAIGPFVTDTLDADEDEIPTRSIAGLADREVQAYAQELYGDKSEDNTPTLARSSENPFESSTKRVDASEAERILRESGQVPARTGSGDWSAEKPFGDSAPHTPPPGLDKQWGDSGITPLGDLRLDKSFDESTPSAAPGLSKPFTATNTPPPQGRLDSSELFGDSQAGVGPNKTGHVSIARERWNEEPMISPSMFDQPAYDPNEDPRFKKEKNKKGGSPLKTIIGIGVVLFLFLIVFVGGLAALVVVSNQIPDEEATDAAAEVDAAQEADAAPEPEPPDRIQLFGLTKPGDNLPVGVSSSRIDRDDMGAFEVIGSLINTGDTALTSAKLEGHLYVDRGSAGMKTVKLTDGGLKDPVTIKKPWLPGEERAFNLKVAKVDEKLIDGEDIRDRFVWVEIDAANGKAFSYKGSVGAVEIAR